VVSYADFQNGLSLKPLSSLGIGGPARYVYEASTIEKMQELLAFSYKEKLPTLVIGKGSNILFDDQGFNGLIIVNKIHFFKEISPGLFTVGAGYPFSRLGIQTARKEWTGLEFASGIPASVGGAIFMNAGANGAETADCLVSVEALDPSGRKLSFSRDELDFSYRYSSFQMQNLCIVSANFQLSHSESARDRQLEILSYRKKTQPYSEKTAGCIFKNPEGGNAGALIEEAGLKGFTVGHAQVSTIHANFLRNKDAATSAEFKELIEKIKEKVYKSSGCKLEHEVREITPDG
jgi:UDP-N-acetylmuramate dehydrogenase